MKHYFFLFALFFFLPQLWAMEPENLKAANNLQRLLAKKKLERKHRLLLLDLCLNNIDLCVDKSEIYRKLTPKKIKYKDSLFAYKLYKLIKNTPNEEGKKLFNLFLTNTNINVHELVSESGDTLDLALQILIENDPNFSQILLKHPNFNPNQSYGSKRYPLSVMLLQNRNYEAISLLIASKGFDIKKTDADGNKLGYHILFNLSSTQDEELFIKLMGSSKIYYWDFLGLGLHESKNFDNFMFSVLKNEDDRLTAVKEIINQLVFQHENQALNNSVMSNRNNLIDLFNNIIDGKHPVSREFYKNICKVVADLKLNKVPLNFGTDFLDFWTHDLLENLGDYNLSHLTQALTKHEVLEDNHNPVCTICFDDNLKPHEMLRATIWCEHAFCKNCLFEHTLLLVNEKDSENETEKERPKELFCAFRDCNQLLPPSLYVALWASLAQFAMANKTITDKANRLAKSYKYLLESQRKTCTLMRNNIPCFLPCATENCSGGIIIDKNKQGNRAFTCKTCKNRQLALAQGSDMEAQSLSFFTNPGTCSRCGQISDKISGCNSITCPHCKKGAYFRQL